MAITYGDFKFDPKHGFTGSCGKKPVKGYMRGGPVRKARGGPADEYEASEPKSKSIEDIIEDTKDIVVKAQPKGKSTIPDMSPSDMRRAKSISDAASAQRKYDADTEDMRNNPMNKAKGGAVSHTGRVPYGRAYKAPSSSMPSAMAVPKPAAPRAPKSLAGIAQSRNPAMMMKKGGDAKIKKVMDEFKAGELHSGSKKGPTVKNRKQAIAIALAEANKGKK